MKKKILSEMTFGESIAELEAAKLQSYFIETDYWKNIRSGKNDIVYGAKGCGKSAIYTSLVNDTYELFGDGTLIASAENPSGNTAFSNLTIDPPTSQVEFTRLWKLYFLVITAQVMREFSLKDDSAKKIQQILEDCNLLPSQNKLSSFIRACLDFIRRLGAIKEISTTSEIDGITGQFTGQRFSISFDEPSESNFKKGILPIEHVYELLCKSLKANNINLWIIVDRLDVAFADDENLESNALKALFKTYLDLAPFQEIRIKIFLRDDIWRKITTEGFREASHITKFEHIVWNKEGLMNLIIRRLLDNEIMINTFSLDKNRILSSYEDQEKCFYRFFPSQIDIGSRRSKTFEWILSHTRDGNLVNTPREIIQLLNHARTLEIKRIENGINDLAEDQLISRVAIKEAVAIVSKQRIEQTLYAEYPRTKILIEKLRNDKAEHTIETLRIKWEMNEADAKDSIRQLSEIGFLEEKGRQPNIRYKIPFIYRPYLSIVQGTAISDSEFEDIEDDAGAE